MTIILYIEKVISTIMGVVMKLDRKFMAGISVAVVACGASAETIVLQQGLNNFSGATDTYIMSSAVVAAHPDLAVSPETKDFFHLHRC